MRDYGERVIVLCHVDLIALSVESREPDVDGTGVGASA